MNRADADRCYKCRAPRATSTMATVHERRLADVAMPGVDQLDRGQAEAIVAYGGYVAVWPLGWVSAGLLFLAALFETGLAVLAAVWLVPVIWPETHLLGDRWFALFVSISL
jgi:hypothetical protein